MAKIKQLQSKRKARQQASKENILATLVVSVTKKGTNFNAGGSVIDIANGVLTASVKHPGIRAAILLCAHELGNTMKLETVEDYKQAAIETVNEINKAQQPAQKEEE